MKTVQRFIADESGATAIVSLEPIPCTTAIIATEIPAAISPYSHGDTKCLRGRRT